MKGYPRLHVIGLTGVSPARRQNGGWQRGRARFG